MSRNLKSPPVSFEMGPRLALVTKEQSRRRQLPLEALPADGSLGIVETQDLWIEEPVDGDPRWMIASRIIGDERGVPVVAEVRVFPNPQGEDQHRAHGDWAAQILGCRARPIPRGGVTSSLVRKRVAPQLARHSNKSAPTLREVQTSMLKRIPNSAAATSARIIEAAGITYKSPFEILRSTPAPGVERPRRGRPVVWTDEDLLRVGLVYDDSVRNSAGRTPVVAVRQALGVKHAQARNLIAAARKKGFIRAAPNQGSAAEPLSDAERSELVEELERLERNSRNKRSRQ